MTLGGCDSLHEKPPNRPDTVSHLASVRHTTVSMSNPADRVEIITSVQRRRRWTAAEKVQMVEETFEPGMTVSLVARRHGVAPNQLFTWRRLVVEGALTAAGSGEQVVLASDYRALQSQVRELQRLLGKKTLEAEILKEALEHATGSKKQRATARHGLCRRRRGGMGCLRANCSPGAGWPEQGGLLRSKRLPHSRWRLSAGRLRRPVRHRSPNALKVRRTCHTHLVLSVLRAGSRSCWRAGVVWWSTMASIQLR